MGGLPRVPPLGTFIEGNAAGRPDDRTMDVRTYRGTPHRPIERLETIPVTTTDEGQAANNQVQLQQLEAGEYVPDLPLK